MSSDPLPDPAISAALGQLPGWSRQGEALVITWRFPSFGAVIEFLADARPGIDQADHHPTWTNTYNRLAVRLILIRFQSHNNLYAGHRRLACVHGSHFPRVLPMF